MRYYLLPVGVLLASGTASLAQTDAPPFIFRITTTASFGAPGGPTDTETVFSDGYGPSESRGESRSELSQDLGAAFANNVATVNWEPSRVSIQSELIYSQPGGIGGLWDGTTSHCQVEVWARGPRGTSVRIDYEFDNLLSYSGCNAYGGWYEDVVCAGNDNEQSSGSVLVTSGAFFQQTTFPEFPGVLYSKLSNPTCPQYTTNDTAVTRGRNTCGTAPSFAMRSRMKVLDYELVDGSPPLAILYGPVFAVVGSSTTWVSNSHDPDDGGPPPGNGIIETAWMRDGLLVSTDASFTKVFTEQEVGQITLVLQVTDNEGMEDLAAKLVEVVRLEDIVDCMTGPYGEGIPGYSDPSCYKFDANGNGYIDMYDIAAMQTSASGLP